MSDSEDLPKKGEVGEVEGKINYHKWVDLGISKIN